MIDVSLSSRLSHSLAWMNKNIELAAVVDRILNGQAYPTPTCVYFWENAPHVPTASSHVYP